MISGDLKICILNADNILLDKVLAIEKMIGKFSRIKEINHFYCAGLLPNINDRCLSLQKTERNDQKTLQGSPKKDRVLTLEKMREKLRKQIQGGRSNTVGTLQNSFFSQKNSSKSFSKTQATEYISKKSRIHTITDSPVFAYEKGKEFSKRQSLYSHKIRMGAEKIKNEPQVLQKQHPMFSIKLLKAFLRNDGSLPNAIINSPKVRTLPLGEFSENEQSKLNFKLKSIEELEMNVTQIRIKNSLFPKKRLIAKDFPLFVAKRNIERPRDSSKRIIPVHKLRPKKSFLSERTLQDQPSTPSTPLRKKHSEQIEADLMQLSEPKRSSLRRPIQTQPSLSAWD